MSIRRDDNVRGRAGRPNLAMLRAIERALQWLPAPQGLSTNPDPPQPFRMRPAAD